MFTPKSVPFPQHFRFRRRISIVLLFRKGNLLEFAHSWVGGQSWLGKLLGTSDRNCYIPHTPFIQLAVRLCVQLYMVRYRPSSETDTIQYSDRTTCFCIFNELHYINVGETLVPGGEVGQTLGLTGGARIGHRDEFPPPGG